MDEPTSLSELLRRSRAVYATCEGYQDRGRVVTVFDCGAPIGRHTRELSFETAFRRPDRLRFEYAYRFFDDSTTWERSVVLLNAHGIRSSWSREPGTRQHESIGAALGAGTGVSDGTAHTVPYLLGIGVEGAPPLPEPSCAERLDDGIEADHACVVIATPQDFDALPRKLWLDARDGLIRRIDTSHRFDAAYYAHQRAEYAERLKQAREPEHRELIERLLEQLERRQNEFRTEVTTHYEPSLEIPDESVFATPPEWSE